MNVLARFAPALIALMALGACDTPGAVTRNALANSPFLGGADAAHAPVPLNPSYRVSKVDVRVPETLRVSEANLYFPSADIVWREDPAGDRYAQVDKIVTDALRQGTAEMRGKRAVELDVVVTRFHALTEKVRYTYGGTHDLKMLLTVRDAKTGEILEPAREIGFKIPAYGGQKALDAERRGETQKVRITGALIEMIRYEMTRPRDFLQG